MAEILVTPLIAACFLALSEDKKMIKRCRDKTEKTILLRPNMAWAYAEYRKWVTRRPITRLNGIGRIKNLKRLDERWFSFWDLNENVDYYTVYEATKDKLIERCPYGQAGERIRLLTTWAVSSEYDDLKPSELPTDINIWSYFYTEEKPHGFGPCSQRCGLGRLRMGRHLPLSLRDQMPYPRILSIGAERVQDIKTKDIYAEGAITEEWAEWREDAECVGLPPGSHIENERDVFEQLWNTIHGPGAWERNDWVWPIELQKYSEVSE